MVKKKDDIPDWVSDEIQNAKFKKPEEVKELDIGLNFMVQIIKQMYSCMIRQKMEDIQLQWTCQKK